MRTLERIQSGNFNIPMTVSWYLSNIGMAQGMQELFMRQSPQRLKVLREHAIAESAISSNRIEGVEIDQSRVGTVIFGRPALKDRDEQEVSRAIYQSGKIDRAKQRTLLRDPPAELSWVARGEA